MKTLPLEFAMLLRGGRTVATAVVFALIVLVSGVSSWIANSNADSDKQGVATAERERWLEQGRKDPHKAAHYSVYAFKTSLPLQSLDPGIQPFVGQAVWLEPHWQNDMVYRPLQEAEPFQRMGLANPAKFLIEFAPLIIFLVAFAATASDRERGIMRLALGAARSPGTYVWGKWAGVLIFSSIVLLVPAALIGGGATAFAWSADNGLRLVSWFIAFAIYFAILAAIGIAVCLNAPTARLGFAILLGLWAILALVAPRAASASANALTPLPSFQGVKLQMEREAPIYWSAETAEKQTLELMNKYGVSRKEDLPVDLRGALLDLNERRSHGIFDRILGGFYRLVAEQDEAFSRQSWMSPAVAAYALSSALAGSNFAHHRDFITFAENYRRTLVNRLNGELLRGASSANRGTGYRMSEFKARPEDYATVPKFEYSQPRIGLAFASAGTAPIFLIAWLLAALSLVTWTARRAHP